MKEVKHYICEVCGTEYNDKKKCMDCESKHIKPVSIEKFRHISMTQNAKGYPMSVDIKMSNGEVVTYKR